MTTFCGTHKINQIMNAQSEKEYLLTHAIIGIIWNFIFQLHNSNIEMNAHLHQHICRFDKL